MIQKIACTLFCSLMCASQLAAHTHVKRPKLAQHHKERLTQTINEYKASKAVTIYPDPALHGWWKSITRGDLGGFGFNALTDDIDVYIFIDTTAFTPEKPLVQINTLCGTPTYPRKCSLLDIDGAISLNHYYVPSSTELVHVLDRNGPLFDPKLKQSWWSLKLQPDGVTLAASSDSQPYFEGYGATLVLFQKADLPPALTDVNPANPVELIHYIRNAWLLQYNQAQNRHLQDRDYLPQKEAKALFQKLCSTGITFETKIRKVRVSVPGVHDRQEFDDFTSYDLLTDIFTDEFSYATAGSTVEISGFTGVWAKMNGVYVNGVAIDEEGGIPNPSRTHIDASSSLDPKKGTFRNVYNHFLLDFDSSDKEQFPRDVLGFATQITGNPTVRVTHQVSPTMEYPAFYAAVRALFFMLYKVSQHNAQVGFFKPGSMFLIDSWQELKEAIKQDSYWASSKYPGNNLVGTRTSQKVPSGFYNNPVMAERGVTTYNDPFSLTQRPSSFCDYNIVLANYIVHPKNLYWALSGTPTGPYQFDPKEVQYKSATLGPTPLQFVGALGNLQVENGKAVAENPDPAYYTIFGTGAGTTDARDANAYYIGQIDPQLTEGKVVGYLRWLDEDACDPHEYLLTATFAPVVPVTVKYGREALTKLFSSITAYFQNDLDCDAVIIDIRSYNGGYGYSYTLAELFGDDRTAGRCFWTKKEDLASTLIDLADEQQFSFYNNVATLDAASTSRFFVEQNETNYGPGAVFRGNFERPKKVIILTDNAACSMGDAFSHYFLGENLDGNLGSYTFCTIIGDIDGRLKGAASYENPMPMNDTSSFLTSASGAPISPIYIRSDFACGEPTNGRTFIPFNLQSNFIAPSFAPSLRGQAGGAPLINDWEHTVWRDLGLIKAPRGHFSPLIKREKPRFKIRSTWRDSWLEQAILQAVA